MNESRTKNASRNIVFGFAQQTIGLLLPFVIRTILIYTLGADYLGLNSLFSSILQVLSLTELGVGSAMVYNMYKPIAENDTASICSLLKLYRKLYLYIGVIMLLIGVLLTPFLKYLVIGTVPNDVDLYVLYAIYILNSSISYLSFGYMQAIFIALQRSDITSKINLAVGGLMYSVQIVVLLLMRNYYAYIVLLPVSTLLQNVTNAVIVKKRYPQYKCGGMVSKETRQSIIRKTGALFGTKMSSIVLQAADTLVISAFLGLTQVAIYGNYYYILNAVVVIMTIPFGSLTASIGNSIVTETEDKNYFDFRKLTLANFWLTGFCSTCLLCLYQPFMELWVGKEFMYDNRMVFLFVGYFFIYQSRRVVLTYKDAAGIWWEDRFRPYVIMLFNLVTNIILVQIIGVYGVIISTLISMFISIPWENYTVFRYIFKRKSSKYYLISLYYIVVSAIGLIAAYFICSALPLNGIASVVVRLVICCFLSNSLYYLAYQKTGEFRALAAMLKYILKI